MVITVTWVTAGLFSTALGLAFGHDKLHTSLLYVQCSFISSCLFIIFVAYSSIVVKVYCGAHPQHHGAASRERKLTKTLFIVTLVSLMTCLPYSVYKMLELDADIMTSPPKLTSLRLNNIFFILGCVNSLVNPILYTIRMPEFRRALVSVFRRQHSQVQVQIPLRVIRCN